MSDFIHLDGQCRTCGKHWGGTFTKSGLERKVESFERGDSPSDPILDCGHPLKWSEKDYRVTLDLFNAVSRMIDRAEDEGGDREIDGEVVEGGVRIMPSDTWSEDEGGDG